MTSCIISASSDDRSYYSDSGRTIRKYDMNTVLSSPTHRLLSKYSRKKLSENDFWRSRNAALIDNKCKARLRMTDQHANDVILPCFNSSKQNKYYCCSHLSLPTSG